MNNSIHFDAEVRSIKSCADRSFNLVLNIPEYNVEQVQELMTKLNDMVAVAMIQVNGDNENRFKKYQ